jgi:hypothetical protein
MDWSLKFLRLFRFALGMTAISDIVEVLTGELMAGARESARLTGVADRNLTQGLGVVNTNLIQTHGGTTDDSATMSALRTAIHVPQKDGP